MIHDWIRSCTIHRPRPVTLQGGRGSPESSLICWAQQLNLPVIEVITTVGIQSWPLDNTHDSYYLSIASQEQSPIFDLRPQFKKPRFKGDAHVRYNNTATTLSIPLQSHQTQNLSSCPESTPTVSHFTCLLGHQLSVTCVRESRSSCCKIVKKLGWFVSCSQQVPSLSHCTC